VRDAQRDQRASERQDLRSRYSDVVSEWKAARSPLRKELYDAQKFRQKEVTEQHKRRRNEIRGSALPIERKRALYSIAAFEIALRREELAATIKAEREQFRMEKVQGFREWAETLASQGDQAAIGQARSWTYAEKRKLKERALEETSTENVPQVGVRGEGEYEPSIPERIGEYLSWTVDNQTGHVDYAIQDRSVFRDTGRSVKFTSDGATDSNALEAGLRLAGEKFLGRELQLHGDAEFKERILKAAIENRLNIRFADPDLEERRRLGTRPDLRKFRSIAGTASSPVAPTPKSNWAKHRAMAGMSSTRALPDIKTPPSAGALKPVS
jgi:hypothetical protein